MDKEKEKTVKATTTTQPILILLQDRNRGGKLCPVIIKIANQFYQEETTRSNKTSLNPRELNQLQLDTTATAGSLNKLGPAYEGNDKE